VANPEKLVVGVWQGPCQDREPERNFNRAAEVIDEAAAAGCDFVCLPETFLTGYGPREIVVDQAIEINDKRLLDLARRAKDRNVVTLVGLSERRGKDIKNTQAVLDGGTVAGTYSKVLPTGGEYKAGMCSHDELPVFTARGVCFGIQICHDSSFPQVAATLALKGAKILFSPHYNAIKAELMDEHRIKVRNNHIGVAAQNYLVVARSNVIVTSSTIFPEHLCYGDSAIFSPLGQPLAEAGLFTERLVYAEVSKWLGTSRWALAKEFRPALIHQWTEAAMKAYRAGEKS
jgi:predicted amidohydrolase